MSGRTLLSTQYLDNQSAKISGLRMPALNQSAQFCLFFLWLSVISNIQAYHLTRLCDLDKLLNLSESVLSVKKKQ